MNLRIIIILSSIIYFCPIIIYGMSDSFERDWPWETSPMDIDSDFYEDEDSEFQDAHEFLQADNLMILPINNIHEFTVALNLWISIAKDPSPEAQKRGLEISKNLVRGIEKLYKQNKSELLSMIEQLRQSITLDQQKVIDECVANCRRKAQKTFCYCSPRITALATFMFLVMWRYFLMKSLILN